MHHLLPVHTDKPHSSIYDNYNTRLLALHLQFYSPSLFPQQMLIYNPGKRLTAKSALKHPYFDDLDKSTLPAAGFNK